MNALTLHKLELKGPLARVRLTRSEAQMVKAFSSAPDGVLTFSFIAQVLDMDLSQELDKAALQVRMVRLRKKIHSSGAQGSVIESVRNVGYQLYEPIRVI